MKIYIDKLDTTFGLMKWGFPYPYIGFPRNTKFLICKDKNGKERLRIPINADYCNLEFVQHDYLEECNNEDCKNICKCLRTDGTRYDKNGNLISSFLNDEINPKINHYSRKLVIAFYQALMERLLISRLSNCDLFAERLRYYNYSQESQPLKCHIYGWDAIDFPDEKIWCILDRCSRDNRRRRTGWQSLNCRARLGTNYGFQCGENCKYKMLLGIKDGRMFRSALNAVIEFLKHPPTNKNLFPPTPTKSANGMIPLLGLCLTDEKWFSKEDMDDAAFNCRCREKKIKTLYEKVLPRFGITSFENNWLADMTMRKAVPHTGIDTLEDNEKAVLFRSFVCSLPISFNKESIIEAFASQSLRTDDGDPSGDFAAEYYDKCVSENLACWLSGNCDIYSKKFSALPFAYAYNILGSFGQNTYKYKKISSPQFFYKEITGYKQLSIKTTIDMKNADGCKICGAGFNPYEERLLVNFYPEKIYENADVYCYWDYQLKLRASTDYTTEYPWVGGKKILQHLSYSNCNYSCVSKTLEELLACDCGTWKVWQEIGGESGHYFINFRYGWNDRCGSNVKTKFATLLCGAEAGTYNSAYPAADIISSGLYEYLKDINMVWLLKDEYNNIFDDSSTKTALVQSKIIKQNLLDLNRCIWSERKDFLEPFLLPIANIIDDYLKSNPIFLSKGRTDNVLYCYNIPKGSPLLESVILPKQFPITCKDIFEGGRSLIDNRKIADYRAIFADKNNYIEHGYSNFTFDFDECGVLTWINATDSTGAHVGFAPVKTTFRCKAGGVEHIGYLLDNSWKIIGKIVPCFGKWEDYDLRDKHSINIGDAFGIVRWDFKVMKRID